MDMLPHELQSVERAQSLPLEAEPDPQLLKGHFMNPLNFRQLKVSYRLSKDPKIICVDAIPVLLSLCLLQVVLSFIPYQCTRHTKNILVSMYTHLIHTAVQA